MGCDNSNTNNVIILPITFIRLLWRNTKLWVCNNINRKVQQHNYTATAL